jgi:hypothetical protein
MKTAWAMSTRVISPSASPSRGLSYLAYVNSYCGDRERAAGGRTKTHMAWFWTYSRIGRCNGFDVLFLDLGTVTPMCSGRKNSEQRRHVLGVVRRAKVRPQLIYRDKRRFLCLESDAASNADSQTYSPSEPSGSYSMLPCLE